MPLIRAIRTLNAMEAGTLSGSALDALFSDAARWVEFHVLLTMPGQVRRILAASTTRAALASSAVAGARIFKSDTARSALLSDSSFLNELFAGSGAASGIVADADAFGVVLSQVSLRMAMFNSDAMLNAIASTSAALTAARASSAYSVVSQSFSSATTTISGLNAAGSYVLLGVSKNIVNSMGLSAITTRRSGSTRPNSVGAFGTATTDATSQTLVTPLVSPFGATMSPSIASVWYFGVLRCDA